MNIPASVHWVAQDIVLIGVADLGIISRMIKN